MFRKLAMVSGVVVMALIFAAGCRNGVPVQDFVGQPVPASTVKVTDVKVRDAILKAGRDKGWQITPEGNGLLRGTLYVRSHIVVVRIAYTAKDYSINYADSTNLEYKDGLIHPNYNKWVNALRQTIDMELSWLK